MSNIVLWGLFVVSFIVSSTSAMKVGDLGGSGQWNLHLFYFGLMASFCCAYGLYKNGKKSRNKESGNETAEVNSTSSPNQYLDRIGELFSEVPPGQQADQKRIEFLQAVCLEMANERFRYMQEYGIQTFAEFFEPFSHGERYLNRSWSALIDDYPAESSRSFEISREYFEIARAKARS